MKKWKVVLSAVLATAAIAAACGAVGCKKKDNTTGQEHTHTYASEWSYSQQRHWKGANCEHKEERSEVALHTFGTDDTCTVCGYKKTKGGLVMSKTTTVYELDAATSTQTAWVKTGDITVKKVDENGTETELNSSQYTLEYYCGDQKLESLKGLGSGAYNIWAKAELDGQNYEAFVVAYVVDDIVSFQSTQDCVTEQPLGLDCISETWKFELSFKSGNKITVGLDDENITRTNFTTFAVASAKTSSVSYTYVGSTGKEKKLVCDMIYTIRAAEGGGVKNYQYSFDEFGDQWLEEDKVTLTQKDFVGANSFITVIGSDVVYRGKSNKRLEIRNTALSVEFKGIGLLSLTAGSNTDSNQSTVAVIDEEGNYLAATYTATNVMPDDDNNFYGVTGKAGAQLDFAITKPGVYKIITVDEIIFNGDAFNTPRVAVLVGLNMTDITEGAN